MPASACRFHLFPARPRPGSHADNRSPQVIDDGKQAGNQDQGQNGGECHSGSQRQGHGDEKSGLHVRFHNKRRQPADRTERCQQNSPKTTTARLFDRFKKSHSFGKIFINPLDQNDGIVDDHARQGNHTEHGHHRQGVAENEMADNSADDTKGDGYENHQRLNIGPEYCRNDNKYSKNSQRKGHLE